MTPGSWETVKLKDVCQVTSSLVDPKEPQFASLPHIGAANIESDSGRLFDVKTALEEGLISGKHTFDATMVLYSKIRPYLKKVARPDYVGLCSADIYPLYPDDSLIDRDFLYHMLLTPRFTQYAESGSARAGMPKVNRSHLFSYEFPLPPLSEQRRIVSVLDAAFAGLATATAHTQKNLQNARELFDSKFQFALDSLSAETPRLTLQQLRESGWITDHMDGNHGGDYPRKSEFIDSGVPYLSANAMVNDGINMAKAKYLSKERASKLRKGFAKDGDVLFAHNATVGPVAILRTDEPLIVLGTSLTYYRCNPDYILPEYLAHYMRSRSFVKQFEQVMGQSTRNQVPITKQREFFHIIPTLEVQKQIASQLDELLDSTVRAQALYRRKLAALSELKQSLLHRAFRGGDSGAASGGEAAQPLSEATA